MLAGYKTYIFVAAAIIFAVFGWLVEYHDADTMVALILAVLPFVGLRVPLQKLQTSLGPLREKTTRKPKRLAAGPDR